MISPVGLSVKLLFERASGEIPEAFCKVMVLRAFVTVQPFVENVENS